MKADKVTLVGRDLFKIDTKVISQTLIRSNDSPAGSADITKEAEVPNVIEQTISSFDTAGHSCKQRVEVLNDYPISLVTL